MIERERTFFANVTHDLMTPITIARGHVDILGRSGTPTAEELAETKQVIVEELKRIESMVGDLLLVGRLDDDSAGLQRERIDVEDFLDVVADRWAVVGERAWTIDIDAPGTFLADGNTLAQALDNVVENAVSYTVPGDAITLPGPRPTGTILDDRGDRHRAGHPGARPPPRLRPLLPCRPRPFALDRRLRPRPRDRARRGRGARRHGLDRVAAGRRHAPHIELPEYRRGSRGGLAPRAIARPPRTDGRRENLDLCLRTTAATDTAADSRPLLEVDDRTQPSIRTRHGWVNCRRGGQFGALVRGTGGRPSLAALLPARVGLTRLHLTQAADIFGYRAEEVAAHYGVSMRTLSRWLAAAGA